MGSPFCKSRPRRRDRLIRSTQSQTCVRSRRAKRSCARATCKSAARRWASPATAATTEASGSTAAAAARPRCRRCAPNSAPHTARDARERSTRGSLERRIGQARSRSAATAWDADRQRHSGPRRQPHATEFPECSTLAIKDQLEHTIGAAGQRPVQRRRKSRTETPSPPRESLHALRIANASKPSQLCATSGSRGALERVHYARRLFIHVAQSRGTGSWCAVQHHPAFILIKQCICQPSSIFLLYLIPPTRTSGWRPWIPRSPSEHQRAGATDVKWACRHP